MFIEQVYFIAMKNNQPVETTVCVMPRTVSGVCTVDFAELFLD
jgi:hypothetical protein